MHTQKCDLSDFSREFPCKDGDELGSPLPQIGDLSSGGALTSGLGTGTPQQQCAKRHRVKEEELVEMKEMNRKMHV